MITDNVDTSSTAGTGKKHSGAGGKRKRGIFTMKDKLIQWMLEEI